jgi:hypothetical protein
LLFATRFAPDDLFQRVIAEFSRKSAPHAKFNAAREAKKIRRRQILAEPDLRQHVDGN